MHEFCTLFDVNYLTRGLVLYRSLERVGADFRLSVYCMDGESERILRRLNLPSMKIIGLDELERHNAELLGVKPTRTQVEYCWTATPAVCLHALETEPAIDAITYVDADLMFFAEPQPVFDEMGDASVLIIPHRYAPRWRYHEPTSGIYNVQFMTFRRDDQGTTALQWWHDRCIEWCYYRVEDGKLGDQKYLDDWPERFAGVHVLQHPGAGLAPWNVEQYTLERRGEETLVDGQPLIFYHYHSLRLYRGVTLMRSLGMLSGRYHLTRRPFPLVWTEDYPMSDVERRSIWEPYLNEIGRAFMKVRAREPRFQAGFLEVDANAIAKEFAGRIARRVSSTGRSVAARSLRFVRERHADHRASWKNPDVARQMADLVSDELGHPETVAPYRAFIEAIDELLRENDLPNPARILDFGCGVGHYSELLETRFPGRFAYTGCDYSEAMIEAARSRWPDSRQFVVNDLFANRLPLESFDVVFAGALVDVVPEYQQALDVLLGGGARYVMLHRQQITDGAESHVETVGGYAKQTTYRSFVSRDDLQRIAARNGREIMAEFEVDGSLRTFVFRSITP